ncbi:hypothetical protein ACFOMD_00790 [Sphingoaurantiacus capsulatus]|uniref:Uncharacterized protein n=1 Tax=Sphingoaurantiacus capsulatus TaxID=1771310 RepID=A0ABV7X4J6_9SPHN
MKRPSQSAGAIFAVPLLVGLLSLVGLVAALTGDGLRNALSWVTLGVPVAAVFWAMRARRS